MQLLEDKYLENSCDSKRPLMNFCLISWCLRRFRHLGQIDVKKSASISVGVDLVSIPKKNRRKIDTKSKIANTLMLMCILFILSDPDHYEFNPIEVPSDSLF